MTISIKEIEAQLQTDVEATHRLLLAAMDRSDLKAVRTWQNTLAAAKAAHGAVSAYAVALEA